jgi:glutathione S-transferase
MLALNPAGELPVLVTADVEPASRPASRPICGAYAIAEYLADTVPIAPGTPRIGVVPPTALFPGCPEERAEVRRLVDWFALKIDREVTRELLAEKVYTRLTRSGRGHVPDVDVLRAVRANLRYHLHYVAHLTAERRWLAGPGPSFADMAAAAHLSVADYLGEIHWADHPRAKLWYSLMKSRPSMRGLLADRLPGFAPAPTYADLDF